MLSRAYVSRAPFCNFHSYPTNISFLSTKHFFLDIRKISQVIYKDIVEIFNAPRGHLCTDACMKMKGVFVFFHEKNGTEKYSWGVIRKQLTIRDVREMSWEEGKKTYIHTQTRPTEIENVKMLKMFFPLLKYYARAFFPPLEFEGSFQGLQLLAFITEKRLAARCT